MFKRKLPVDSGRAIPPAAAGSEELSKLNAAFQKFHRDFLTGRVSHRGSTPPALVYPYTLVRLPRDWR